MRREWQLHALTSKMHLNGATVRLMETGHTGDRVAVSFIDNAHAPIRVRATKLRSLDDPTVTLASVQAAVDHLRTHDDPTLREFTGLFETQRFDEAASCATKWTLDNAR